MHRLFKALSTVPGSQFDNNSKEKTCNDREDFYLQPTFVSMTKVSIHLFQNTIRTNGLVYHNAMAHVLSNMLVPVNTTTPVYLKRPYSP